MTRMHVLTGRKQSQLWLWRDPKRNDPPNPGFDAMDSGSDENGLRLFEAVLDHQLHEPVHAKIHEGACWEPDEHAKTFPRTNNYRFPDNLWCSEGAARVLTSDPFATSIRQVRIHLITAKKYRDGMLFIWRPDETGRTIKQKDVDGDGPFFDVTLEGAEQSLFLFKFMAADGKLEPDYANRLWCAQDGAEVWTHSLATGVSTQAPSLRPLIVRARGLATEPAASLMHLWQADSDFEADLDGVADADGWIRFERPIYTDWQYGFMFHDSPPGTYWEDNEARRNVILRSNGDAYTINGQGQKRRIGSAGIWTLEGDHELFGSEPAAEKSVRVEVSNRAPGCGVEGPLELDVWINRGRQLLHTGLSQVSSGCWVFKTYPDVVTSFRFRSGQQFESVPRHTIKLSESDPQFTNLYVVLGRADPVSKRPASDLFSDPPFPLIRPGAWLESGQVRFAIHCPEATTVDIVGEWTNWESRPMSLHSTRDGTYWWGQFPASAIASALGRQTIHGVLYKLRLNGLRFVQDPAADWVENSAPDSASKLADHGAYSWRSNAWQRPGWEHLIVYQAHPNAFAKVNGGHGFDAIAQELTKPDGYLRNLKTTALLLMPVAEYAMSDGWGYNPSFYYAVESGYGGPDALKRLVDACHEQGVAVLLDVVFNHAGIGDNVLWTVARQSFLDGDTEWGMMINFDHPQVIHFFEQNLVHFMNNYRIDGFRFDFTNVIRSGNSWAPHVKQPGSGGGYEFLQKIRAAAHNVDARCLFMAEQYPVDLGFTGPQGPMDTQWHDQFHDRIVEASRGSDVMGSLADALKSTQASNNDWYEVTNYPESHDEVGNINDRITAVAGPGQGYRRNKVAAAATLLSRGVPMWFMGSEYGEWRQFQKDGSGPIELHFDEANDDRAHLLHWWNRLCDIHRTDARVHGPAPIGVNYAQDRMLAFTRGENADLFVLLNFGDWSGWRSLADLNLPDGDYKELLNSTWGEYRVGCEGETERSNGGWAAHLNRGSNLNIPPYGAVVLERN